MEVGWDAQVHHIDVGPIENSAIIVIGVWNIEFLRKGLSTLDPLGGDRNDIHFESPQLREVIQMKVGGELGTDHSEAHFIHNSLLLKDGLKMEPIKIHRSRRDALLGRPAPHWWHRVPESLFLFSSSEASRPPFSFSVPAQRLLD